MLFKKVSCPFQLAVVCTVYCAGLAIELSCRDTQREKKPQTQQGQPRVAKCAGGHSVQCGHLDLGLVRKKEDFGFLCFFGL